MNRRSSRKRRYRSPLRDDQQKATRARILDGAFAELQSGASDVVIPALAKRSGVSVPTIYRYFPTRKDLLVALVEHADGMVPWPAIELDPDDVAPFVRTFFEHRAAVAAKLGPLNVSSLVGEMRRSLTAPRRRTYLMPIIDRWAPRLPEPERTWLADLLVILISHTALQAFHEYLSLDAAEAAKRITWLLDALRAHAGTTQRRKR